MWALVVYALIGGVDERTIVLYRTRVECEAQLSVGGVDPRHKECVYISEVFDETLFDDMDTDDVSVTDLR